MNIDVQHRPPALVLALRGRLDAFTTKQLEERLGASLNDASVRYVILDLAELEYLSSAGIRVLVTTMRQMRNGGGEMMLVGLKGYPEKVLALAGFAESFPRHATLGQALAATGAGAAAHARWDQALPFAGAAGTFQVAPWSRDHCEALVLGDIKDVLHCRVTPSLMRSKRFSASEYSLGLGGLGDKMEDYFPILGEMVTIGGTMVWLPTDGHDTADFLIPQKDTGEVTIRTAFNVSLAGHFNDLALFESPRPEGSSIGEICRDIFAFARQHRAPFKGGVFFALRAEVKAAYGAGVLRSPILRNQPNNGKSLIDEENFDTWFEVDHVPRHRDVTGLFTGIALDLRSQFTHHYDQAMLDAAFYVNPGNRMAADDQILHQHGVYFSPRPFHPQPASLDEAIGAVIEDGDFRDMRHAFDNTRLSRAIVGIAYIEQFKRDPAGQPV